MSAHDKILERLRQNETARGLQLEPQRPKPACAEGRIGCTFLAGDRVFDLLTGQHGEVISGTIENVLIPAPKRANG